MLQKYQYYHKKHISFKMTDEYSLWVAHELGIFLPGLLNVTSAADNTI